MRAFCKIACVWTINSCGLGTRGTDGGRIVLTVCSKSRQYTINNLYKPDHTCELWTQANLVTVKKRVKK